MRRRAAVARVPIDAFMNIRHRIRRIEQTYVRGGLHPLGEAFMRDGDEPRAPQQKRRGQETLRRGGNVPVDLRGRQMIVRDRMPRSFRQLETEMGQGAKLVLAQALAQVRVLRPGGAYPAVDK